MSTLQHAIAIATKAHAGQVDKAGAPYITHPLRVAALVPTGEAEIAAVLHDVVEDSPWTLAQLQAEGFSPAVLAAIDAVTRREGEDYDAFVRRAAQDPIGRVVKRADLIDNMDRTRLKSVSAKDEDRLKRYAAALAVVNFSEP